MAEWRIGSPYLWKLPVQHSIRSKHSWTGSVPIINHRPKQALPCQIKAHIRFDIPEGIMMFFIVRSRRKISLQEYPSISQFVLPSFKSPVDKQRNNRPLNTLLHHWIFFMTDQNVSPYGQISDALVNPILGMWSK